MNSPEVRTAATSPRSRESKRRLCFNCVKKSSLTREKTRFTGPEGKECGDLKGLTRFRKTRVSFSFPRSRRKLKEVLPEGGPLVKTRNRHWRYNLFFLLLQGLIVLGEDAVVISSNILASDGVLHALNKLLIPDDIQPLLPRYCNRKSFSRVSSYLKFLN